ncbi:hypothetical protein AUC71_13815 [Methyloceanibacter marginalis]|uniref:Uncharacterized protein n=1 Tax=Methyloceanibacter marginalis TaxID=1774971 RepID=A0A1E3WAB2_9HYPH|nr:hypothetical protein AUC71_13815 [Methyloceanibacter marginalis]
MKDVAADEPELAFQIERAQGLSSHNAVGETGRVSVDRGNHQVGDLVAGLVPGAPVRQLGRHMLAEQTRHMGAGRGEAVV